MRAARGVWFLEFFGHPSVKMLDGGFNAWKAARYPVTSETAPAQADSFTINQHWDVLATVDDVLSALNKKDYAILDTRSKAEHRGTQVRAARGGMIPGSIHIEWKDNLDSSGKFKSEAELKAMYEAAGITSDKEVIS